jgi:hypothetical protein
MGTGGKLLTAFVAVESFTLPVFRSGGRTHLTFWGWLFNHTIFGPPVEYVPEEDYIAELEAFSKLSASHYMQEPRLGYPRTDEERLLRHPGSVLPPRGEGYVRYALKEYTDGEREFAALQ